MSEKPYNRESHLEGALRRVYSSRRTLSHLDAGILTPEQFEQVRALTDALEALEQDIEKTLLEERHDVDDDKVTPLQGARADD
ncbi:hypothetical protein [Haloarcula sp. Atlit-7R]|uniref:hypothetical protein n=1 Tax=Haloarcula sp. Atlit-7R TaxID=2282125 RepID=UPI000EF16ABB|nr:hypothetical protein [Haloarcula sp. Atlit-7R]RLM87898.1 hypothetical protein D3D01_22275 [Haloarcula sp. Atlit-7R]